MDSEKDYDFVTAIEYKILQKENPIIIPINITQNDKYVHLGYPAETYLHSDMKSVLSPTYLKESETIKTCDINISDSENQGGAFWFSIY